MGTIGYGYGSEWHLLRYLGYHQIQTISAKEGLFFTTKSTSQPRISSSNIN